MLLVVTPGSSLILILSYLRGKSLSTVRLTSQMVQSEPGGGSEDVASKHDVRPWPKGMSRKRVNQIQVGNNLQVSAYGNSDVGGCNGYAIRIMDRSVRERQSMGGGDETI